MAFFISPVLKHHNRERFQVTCYSNNQYQDEITAQLKSYAHSWVNCATLTDEQLSRKIWQDKIDILVDLSGHTALNRLGVFARSPAPVQITYLGYPNTTGLTAMNYQLVSQTTTPAGMIDDWSSEQFLHLSESYCCFDPLMSMPAVSELPALRNGYLTFASFSRMDKMSNTTFTLWCEVLQALPTARLLFYNNSFVDNGTRELWLKRFSEARIDPQRLTLAYIPAVSEVFQVYEKVDVVLDTYPYNGCTTTCQALLMSVPVVSLAGELTAARVGLDMLRSVGLTELVAFKPADYVPIVLSLTGDLTYLQTLRMTLRPRMLASPLMDGVGFTRAVELLYTRCSSF
jgi:predicted O-linked N-acetylglucosamine transferase (SPINDLY family)